jgi:hypothetical protein
VTPSPFTTRGVAVALARRGWPVLPCHHPTPAGCSCGHDDCASPAKHPRTPRGLHQATTDVGTIRRWWRQWPDANIGVRTGAAPDGAGVVVIDIDPGHGGEYALAELERLHGALPPTLAATTGGGGRHLWFAHPSHGTVPNSAGRVGGGIDVRGDGGYALVSPSRHASGGRYRWIAAPIAELPAWLLELALPPARTPAAAPPAAKHLDAWARAALTNEVHAVRASADGMRNHTLNRAAFALGQLVGAGHLDEHDVISHLAAAGASAGLGAGEVARTIASGLRAGIAAPRQHPAGS